RTATPGGAQVPSLAVWRGARGRGNGDGRAPRTPRRDRGPAAAERHVNEVEAERQSELFAGEVSLRARSRRAEAVFAGVRFDELDQLLDRLRRHGGGDGGRGAGRHPEGEGCEM